MVFNTDMAANNKLLKRIITVGYRFAIIANPFYRLNGALCQIHHSIFDYY